MLLRRFLTAATAVALSASIAQSADDKAGIQYFEQHIRPVLVAKCYKCHSAESKEVKAGLLLDTRDGLRRGGDSGAAVVPGNIDDSILIEAIRYESVEMPPDEKLSADVIAKFEQWIRMGAPDPRDGKSTPIKREIDFAKAREFWSFQPVRKPDVPETGDASWPKSVIDRFVLASLEAKRIRPVADADLHVLVRRVYFDLVGLPPSPEQIDEFVSAADRGRQAAVSALVDKLLDSPQFGERWGRHWLDVVRFAESTGMERNFTFPHAWKYRDYVIDSFNADKPFDQFIREQVAGDLLPHENAEQRREQLVATGFLTLGPKSLNETNKEQFAMDVVDEQLDTTLRTFMGLTAGCARCHDHKFDPVPSKEYYALAGVFRSTETLYGTGAVQGNRNQGKLIAFSDGEIREIRPEGGDAKGKPKGKPAPAKGGSAKDIKQQLQDAEQALARMKARAEAGNAQARKKVQKTIAQAEQRVAALRRQLKNQKQDESTESSDESSTDAAADLIMAVLDSSKPADTQIRVRGEPNDRGDTVPRGFLTIGSVGHVPGIESEGSGRKALAEWLTQQDNPLTARVAVNRIWQHLFGRGIVPSVDNFGTQGERPSHPELLDWLASEFREHGWSVKSTVRAIVTSRVYQLAATNDAKAAAIDPENSLLWRARHRRLEAEAIRDAILAASGQLDLEPPHTSPVAAVGDGDIGRGLPPARFETVSTKRSVYLPIIRTLVPEALQVFDFPEPSNISGQRDVTTVPTQSLYLMNSGFALEQAEHFAQRLLDESDLSDPARIDLAYRLTLSRPATRQESQETLDFVMETATSLSDNSKSNRDSARLRAWTAMCQALFASAEFRYVE